MNTKNILITGARAPVAIQIIRSLKQEGHRVYITDSTHLVIAKKSRDIIDFFQTPAPNTNVEAYIFALQEIVEKAAIDLVIPLCEEVFYIAKYKDRLHTNVLVDHFEKLQMMHHKGKFCDWVIEHGFHAPKSAFVNNQQELQAFVKESKKESFILKKAYSRFANGTQRMTKDEVFEHTDFPIVIQEFIIGREWCTYSIALQDGITTAIYPSDIHYHDGATIYYEHTKYEQLEQIIEQIVQQLDWHGQIAFDVIECSETKRLYFIECNPRATSGACFIKGAAWFRKTVSQEGAFQLTPLMILKWMRRPNLALYRKMKQAKDLFGLSDGIGLYLAQFQVMIGWFFTSRKLNCSMSEATTKDIEWNGETLQ